MTLGTQLSGEQPRFLAPEAHLGLALRRRFLTADNEDLSRMIQLIRMLMMEDVEDREYLVDELLLLLSGSSARHWPSAID